MLPSKEKNRTRLNGFLATDLSSGRTTVDFQPRAKTENAVFVLALLVLRYAQLGFSKLILILDHCSIHGEAMKAALADYAKSLIMETSRSERAPLADWQRQARIPSFA